METSLPLLSLFFCLWAPQGSAEVVLSSSVGRYFRFDLSQELSFQALTAGSGLRLKEKGYPGLPRFIHLLHERPIIFGTSPDSAETIHLEAIVAGLGGTTVTIPFQLAITEAGEQTFTDLGHSSPSLAGFSL